MRKLLPTSVALPTVAGLILVTGSIAVPAASASAQPANSGTATTEGSAVAQQAQTIAWQKCAKAKDQKIGAQCARFSVPWDWTKPNGPKYSLALKRLPALAGGPAKKLNLFVNPGGPGGSGTELVDDFVKETQLRRSFNVVGWDPRGVPGSTPLLKVCPNKDVEIPETGPFTWPSIASAVSDGADNAVCIQRNRSMLKSLGTNNIVQDLDAMRAAAGDTQLTYLGYSYGTQIGRQYAQRYPNKVRAIVLDGVVYPGNTMNGDVPPTVVGANAAWDFVLAHSSGPIKTLGNEVSTYLQSHTVQVGKVLMDRWRFWSLSLNTVQEKSPGASYQALVCRVARNAGLPATACQSQIQSNDDQFERLVALQEEAEKETRPSLVSPVRCTDYSGRPTAASVNSAFVAKGSRAQTAMNIYNYSLLCTGWPTLNRIPALSKNLKTSTPILLVNGVGDPATSYAGAQQTAARLIGHRFITVQTGKHAIFGEDASACVRNPVIQYLVGRKLPTTNLTCASAFK